jgi:Skp family chaperone for outer membrane proteins
LARVNRRVLMAVRNLTERVEVLEMKVGVLEELPARMSAVEAQIVQLRTEMRGEFSAVRQEMRALNDETRAEMRALNEETKAQMRALNEETKAQTRTLHEEVLDRIAKIGEVTRSPRKRRR